MSISTVEKEAKIVLRIMDREYTVKCSEETFTTLVKSAHYLDCKIHDVMAHKTMAADRVTIVAALSAVHELSLKLQQKEACIDDMCQRLLQLSSKLATALGQ